MNYFDTSFLVPFVLEEPTSPSVDRFLKGLAPGTAVISLWSCVELSSAVAQQVRLGRLSPPSALAAEAEFNARLSESFVTITPTEADFELSRQFLRRYETGLRSGDALHLAIARNHGAQAIYSLDQGFLKAGRLLGLPVQSGIRVR